MSDREEYKLHEKLQVGGLMKKSALAICCEPNLLPERGAQQ